MLLRQFIYGFLLFVAAASYAQQTTGFHLKQFTTEDGLPSNGIKGLQWDRQTGFLWIATEAGVVRFNGMDFKTFSYEDNPQITNERILFLVRNNSGAIYTADNTGNIFSVTNNLLSFKKNVRIAGNRKSNNITIPVSERFFNADHQVENGPYSLQFDKVIPDSDTSCFIVHGGGLYRFTISMNSPEVMLMPGGNIITGFRCRNSFFLVDNKNKLLLLDTKTYALSETELAFDISSTGNRPDKNLFIWENGMEVPLLFSGNSVWKINYDNEKLKAIFICSQIPQDALIRYAQYDEERGIIFIGTDSKGIIIIKKNLMEQLRNERAGPAERTSYYSQLELPDGNVATNEGHIIGKKIPLAADAPFNKRFSNSTYLMEDSLFWFIQINESLRISCLHSYSLLTGKLKAYPKIRENFSQLVMVKSGGRLYMANEFGVYRLKDDSLENVYTYPEVNRQRTHFDIKEISPGILALANCNALLRFDTRTQKMDTLFFSGNYCVRSIWVYKDYVFFGTYGNGLYLWKNGKAKALPQDKNHYLLFTHCFVEDKDGYCWISTNRGLFKANVAEMINAYETNVTQVYYHYFGRNDGMEMTEMNGGCAPCGITLRNKTISFPTMEGLLWVHPQTAVPVLPSGEIFIDEVVIDNTRITPGELESKPLNASKHDIQIRLGFSAWCNKENIYLQYQLNNDKDWKPVNTDNGAIIQLNNLAKGNYVLRIRKLNGFGINNYSYREINFTIPTPWYERLWFYLLCVLALTGLIVLYFRYRTQQYKIRQRKLEQQVAEKTKELQQQNEILEKNNSIKTRLISIISHDIVTPLKFLTVAGKNLIEKRRMMPEELQQETIKEMTNTSQELQFLSTNILNWIKYQNENRRMMKETFNLHELVEQVLGILQSLAKQKSLHIENMVQEGQMVYQYYEPLKILIYNLLTNAIHFTEKGTITVDATEQNGTITIAVKDEGVGMTPEQIDRLMADDVVITSANVDNKKGHGLGYLIIKDLLKTMGATIRIESKKGEGAAVFIMMEK